MVCFNLNCLKGKRPTPTRTTPNVSVPVSLPVPVPLPEPVQQTNNRLSNMSNGSIKSNRAHNEEGSGSDLVGEKKKFLCSFGGKILPRPDGKLVYAGGDTRVIAVPRSISFSEFKRKIEETYNMSRLIIKYRITPEDLDALVSVKSDDDMAFMWDEYNKLSSQNGNPNSTPRLLRLFIFQISPESPPHIDFQKYLDEIECRSSIMNASSARHVATHGSVFHKVMSSPNLTCETHCGVTHHNQRQGIPPCGYPYGGIEAPVVRRGSCHNLNMACYNSSHVPGLHGLSVQNTSKLAQHPLPVYGKYGHEEGPSTSRPASKPQLRAGTPVRPIVWD